MTPGVDLLNEDADSLSQEHRMNYFHSMNFRPASRIAVFAGILCAFALTSRELCSFHFGRVVFHVLTETTTFLMLAYVCGKLLAKLWSFSGRISGCDRKVLSPSSSARRRLRTTPFARANRRAYGYHA